MLHFMLHHEASLSDRMKALASTENGIPSLEYLLGLFQTECQIKYACVMNVCAIYQNSCGQHHSNFILQMEKKLTAAPNSAADCASLHHHRKNYFKFILWKCWHSRVSILSVSNDDGIFCCFVLVYDLISYFPLNFLNWRENEVLTCVNVCK